MRILTIAQMRDLERRTDAAGHTYAEMMENAGRAVALAIQQRRQVEGLHALVLVGPGNNGGDGLVTARYLRQMGAQVGLYIWKRDTASDDNYRRTQEAAIPVSWAAEDTDGSTLRRLVATADVVVDALLGTGVDRPLEGGIKELLERVQQVVAENRGAARAHPFTAPAIPTPEWTARPWIVAVDTPSGIHCDTGAADPATLAADLTVTFACPKIGFYRFPAAALLGELVVADIGIPAQLMEEGDLFVATPQMVADLLPARPLNAHKGTFGKAMIVAGSANYVGAAYLASVAATRVGAGLVTLAAAGTVYSIVASKTTEVTHLILPDDRGAVRPSGVKIIRDELDGYTALLIGPGLGRDPKTVQFVHELLQLKAPTTPGLGFTAMSARGTAETKSLPPLVIDADGLNALADLGNWWRDLRVPAILTPHPGEMSRLRGISVAEIEQDRLTAARSAAGEWQQTVVLKGAFTVIAAPDGRTTITPFANPGLATAGTGDVLAGAIVGLLAQGVEPHAAAVAGAYLHGLAGELAREELGDAGMVAGDLLPALPQAIQALRG